LIQLTDIDFHTLWRKWIMKCVTIASTSGLVNESPTNELKFERGLRQGDPLSPFLFLIVAEDINVFMKATTVDGLFIGYSVGQSDNISTSHLQFADDTLLIELKVELMFVP